MRDQGWSWNSLQPYFEKVERWTAPADQHNTTGQYDPSVHGFTGMTSVGLAGYPQSIDSRVLNTSNLLGSDFAFNLDQNSGNSIGLGWVQATVNGSTRSSSATSYLAPKYLARHNLDVLLNVRVSRVLQTGISGSKPTFLSVEYRSNSDGTIRNITAGKEVILSAGSLGSPHILLNSGIGNSTSLEALGIKPTLNLPDVGQHMVDHPLGGGIFLVSGNGSYDKFNQDPSVRQEELQQWNATGQGPLVDTIVDHLVFQRVPINDSIFDSTPDPAAGPNSPHFELLICNGLPFGDLPTTGNFITVANVVVAPTSRKFMGQHNKHLLFNATSGGSVTVNSTDPFAPPVIDPALLATDFDKVAMRTALKNTLAFFATSLWSDYVITATDGLENATTDAEMDSYLSNFTQTIFHPVGTARMTAVDAKDGVVNPDLTVKGAAGLRIVDASVLVSFIRPQTLSV
ncbi:hypothetical protein H0H93_010953 [Arthromyces matolae]|nr:hypothetical protein H0H93_010953 [Arthromyces matolae]